MKRITMTVTRQKYELWNVKWGADYKEVLLEGGRRAKDTRVNFFPLLLNAEVFIKMWRLTIRCGLVDITPSNLWRRKKYSSNKANNVHK